MGDFAIRGRRVVVDEEVRPAAVMIRGGAITRVVPPGAVPPGLPVDEVGDAVVMPGLVDSHVHINDPGRAEWEGFETATRAAAAGGVTTVVDMPLNSVPPTTSSAGLAAKVKAAEAHLWVDAAFCGGAVPGNADAFRELRAEGVVAFKCFLAPSGVDEFAHLEEADLRVAMRRLADVGAPLLVHAELAGAVDAAKMDSQAPRRYATYLASRPRSAENEAVALVARLCREYGVRSHIVHLSSADALETIRRARSDGAALSVETCPHYLTFAAEEIADGATAFKCAPPIRERENRDRLWAALGAGLIDQVVTDHSPSSPGLKCIESGDFMRAWGGISSLELGLRSVWTEASRRGVSFARIAEWMSAAPARLVGLDGRKGRLAPGFDADIVVWDPAASLLVEPSRLQHRHKLTPYAGRTLNGVVLTTYVRGVKVFDRGTFAAHPSGSWIKRGNR